MKLYRFSPIANEKQLIEAVKYIAVQTTKLSKKAIGKELRITYFTVFAHYLEEYERLIKILNKLGTLKKANNGVRATLKNSIKVGNQKINNVRIRRPDPYRMQVGCSDFCVENYQDFKNKYIAKKAQNLRLIERADYEMIEFFDPDFDVLAYAVSK